MKIKVCGMKEPNNIAKVVNLGVDYIGFIFYEKSPRFVQDNFCLSESMLNATQVKKVGVFVNSSLEIIEEKVVKYHLDLVQLHGEEDADFCGGLKEKLVSLGKVGLIKVFSIGESFDFRQLDTYKPYVDYFLFDTKGTNLGGNGITFDWNILKGYEHKVPFFLSGGIDMQHVENIKRLTHLPIHAIDINSRFEIIPGLKDVEKIKKFKQSL
jgi:phosphoribosylanthranilate isomerase